MPDLCGWAHLTVAGFRFGGMGSARFARERSEVLAVLGAAHVPPADVVQLVPADWPGHRAVQEDGSAWPGRLHPSEVAQGIRAVLAGAGVAAG